MMPQRAYSFGDGTVSGEIHLYHLMITSLPDAQVPSPSPSFLPSFFNYLFAEILLYLFAEILLYMYGVCENVMLCHGD
jgi:hypothetical protein